MPTDTDVPDLGIDLSDETAEGLQSVAGLETPPDSFHEWAMTVYEGLAAVDEALSADDLYVDGASRHAVHLGDRVEHVPCVQDALIAAVLSDADPVTVRSESPIGDVVVEATVSGGAVEVEPTGAVMSFGVSTQLPPLGSGDEPPLDWLGEPDSPLQALSCDYINAFPSSEAFEGWAVDQERVATVELTFEQGLALAWAAADRLFA